MGRADPDREAKWRETMASWEASGQTVKAFCVERGLTANTFYSWRRELRRRDGQEAGRRGREGGGRSRRKRGRRFIQLELGPVASGLRVHLGNEVVIDVPATLDVETLSAVIVAVRRASKC